MSGDGFGAMIYGMMLIIYILLGVVFVQGINSAAEHDKVTRQESVK